MGRRFALCFFNLVAVCSERSMFIRGRDGMSIELEQRDDVCETPSVV